MEIKPDARLLTKQWLGLLTFSIFMIVVAIVFQLLLPLDPDINTPGEVAVVLWPIVGGIVFVTWIISVPLIRLWVKNLAYFIEDDRVTIHKGILSKVKQNIPFRAVTDFRLHRSLYDRFLGIGTIQIQTAGQSRSATGFEGQFSGLVQFDELLQLLRKKLEELHPISQGLTVNELATTPHDGDTLTLILEELRAIRKAMETN